MSNSENEFLWPVRVYYEDTDSGGVVYYANYLKFMESARTEMLRSFGFEQDQLITDQGVIFAVHSLSVKYKKPAVFNDELIVKTKISDCGRASFDFSQSVLRALDESLLCEAEIKVACINAEKFTPTVIPEIMLKKIKQGAGSGS
ncbi:MAG: tol-pal system-associated acyl-CoA thioesterase [Gammaproteobacteria bacterium]|nr:tol-pal system-associated acyl-CoA thioesterase [Gammaproteobacteria bacterium]